jgi:hypothetical protein
LPCQRLWAAPQFWQMKERVRRDMKVRIALNEEETLRNR